MKSGSTGLTVASGSGASHPLADSGRESGFTLLETIVALTVLAITLVAIMQTYVSSAKSAQATDQYFQALIVSQSLMAETLAAPIIKPAEKSGKYGILHWRVSVAPTTRHWNKISNGIPWQLFAIAVTVTWSNGRRIKLQTLKLGRQNG